MLEAQGRIVHPRLHGFEARVHFRLFSRSAGLPQGLRWRFAEHCAITAREQTEVPHPETHCHAGDGVLTHLCTQQCTANLMQLSSSEKANRTHAEIFVEYVA